MRRPSSLSVCTLLGMIAFAPRIRAETVDSHPSDAASVPDAPTRDTLFPSAGSFSATAATGVPYLAIGEVAAGVSSRFAVGAMAGVTPNVVGFGVRPRMFFPLGEGRLIVRVPVFYYPKTNDFG